MKRTTYRFEKYAIADFPVYASAPSRRKILVYGHYHKDAEVNKVIRGTVRVNVGTASYTLHTGDVIFFSPFSIHEIVSESKDATIHGFIFDTELLSGDVDFAGVRDSHFLFGPEHARYAEAGRIFDELHAVYTAKPPSFRLRIKADLLLFTSLLTESGFLPPDGESHSMMRTAPVIRYIKENFHRELTVRELAAILNLCDDSFIRIFKKENGQTPFSYILNHRICESLKLLSENKYSLSEIADRTGFSGAGYFSRVFKEKLGVSPLQYKKEHF